MKIYIDGHEKEYLIRDLKNNIASDYIQGSYRGKTDLQLKTKDYLKLKSKHFDRRYLEDVCAAQGVLRKLLKDEKI